MTRLGARLVGGYCGTTPIHIHEFKKALHLKKHTPWPLSP
ncbi:MAG: homocysteine S-methyltransferase family protein [Dissulfurimicrobium sp.]